MFKNLTWIDDPFLSFQNGAVIQWCPWHAFCMLLGVGGLTGIHVENHVHDALSILSFITNFIAIFSFIFHNLFLIFAFANRVCSLFWFLHTFFACFILFNFGIFAASLIFYCLL